MLLRHLPPTLLLLAPALFTACQSAPASPPPALPTPAPQVKAQTPKTPSAAPAAGAAAPQDVPADSLDSQYATYFVVVADTSRSYSALHGQMLRLSRQYALRIDTLGRYFDTRKNQIVLPENDEDEMYAGDYYPRRQPSHSLSLEYLIEYKDQAGAKTMALVTGIYEREASADSALAVLGKADNKVFKLKSSMYVGCIH
jgi:hypothetical protein